MNPMTRSRLASSDAAASFKILGLKIVYVLVSTALDEWHSVQVVLMLITVSGIVYYHLSEVRLLRAHACMAAVPAACLGSPCGAGFRAMRACQACWLLHARACCSGAFLSKVRQPGVGWPVLRPAVCRGAAGGARVQRRQACDRQYVPRAHDLGECSGTLLQA